MPSYNTVGRLKTNGQNRSTRDFTLFIPHILPFFSDACAYIAHNATVQLGDISGGNFSDYMQPQILNKTNNFHICSFTPQELQSYFNV